MGVQYQFTTPVIARQPANRDAQESNTNVPGRQPVIYQHRSPSIYQTTARQPAIQNNQNNANQDYRVPHERVTQQTYQHQAVRQNPFIRNQRNPGAYQLALNVQNPFIRDQRTPFIAQQPRVDQSPVIRETRQPGTYQHRSPSTYQHRSPFTYQHRSPLTYQHRSPSTYSHRSPSIYRLPVSNQTPSIGNTQTPFTYQNPFIQAYDRRSPFIYQQPYISTRPIQQVAKFKGVFKKQAQGVSKVSQVFVKKDSSTVEKIHQSVPTAQFSD